MSDGNSSAEGEDVQTELTRLRDENARLRGLLGLDDRDAGGHTAAWSPLLIPNTVRSALVDRDSSNESKLALLASMFGARSDVYATRWENPSRDTFGLVARNEGRVVAAAQPPELPRTHQRGLRSVLYSFTHAFSDACASARLACR